jgi:hypothetical protein
MKKIAILLGALTILSFVMCTEKKGKLGPTTGVSSTTTGGNSACDTVTYLKHIAPIMTAECNGCHNNPPRVNISTYAGIKGEVDNGNFKQKVVVNKTMPQGGTLTPKQLELIACWLDKGAPNN